MSRKYNITLFNRVTGEEDYFQLFGNNEWFPTLEKYLDSKGIDYRAQQFMGHTDQQFGEFLAPLIQKETVTEEPQEVTSENTPQETPVPNIRTGTVHLKPGYYAVCDNTGAEIFTGNIGEYRALDLHHGQLVEFRNDSHEIINQNLGDDPLAPLLHYIKHGIVELEPDSQELYIAKDINGQTIKELGCAFDIFYLRQMADRFNIHAGDTVDLYLKEDGYPYINWVYRGYDSETTVQNTSTVKKNVQKQSENLALRLTMT